MLVAVVGVGAVDEGAGLPPVVREACGEQLLGPGLVHPAGVELARQAVEVVVAVSLGVDLALPLHLGDAGVECGLRAGLPACGGADGASLRLPLLPGGCGGRAL